MSDANSELIPLWEVFIRPRTGLAHSHVGSVHAADEVMALQAARDVYTRRGEGVSIWVVRRPALPRRTRHSVMRILNRQHPKSIGIRPSMTFPMMWGICDGIR